MKAPLTVHTGPFLGSNVDTPRIMLDVVYALVPIVLAAVWFFGVAALLVIAASTAGAVLMEWVFSRPRGKSLLDWSAVLTGVMLGLTLPPGFPLWMCFVGGVAGIGLGKVIFGGLGQNLFNPALVGRVFLQAAFPTAITTWAANAGPSGFTRIPAGTFTPPMMHPALDAVTTATPLGMMKFEHASTPLLNLFLGNTAGSLGETSALLIILGGGYLAARRTFDWRIPVSILLTVVVCSGALYLSAPERYPTPQFMLFSGGLLFGTVYMATDPVTSPVTQRGAWIFGIGIGVIVVLIRLFGGLPEGVMYAILLMNAVTPQLNRFTQPRPFGRSRASAAEGGK